METLEGFIKFISSYPTWAKLLLLGNLICIVATLIFAPRAASQPPADESTGMYQLKIEGVELYPHSDEAVVQVHAIVNGTKYIYPSVGGVEWMKVGPTMAGQTFRLPTAERYEIRFEMIHRQGDRGIKKKLLSVETISFVEGKTEGRYPLHDFDQLSKTRDSGINAEVIYSIGPAS